MQLAFLMMAVTEAPENPELRAAFEKEALPLFDGLYGGAVNLTKSRSDADDLIQETFLKAYRKFHQYQDGTNLKAWLYRIMMNTFISRYRKKHRSGEKANLDDVVEFAESPDEQDFTVERSKYLELNNRRQLKDFAEGLDENLKRAIDSLQDEFRHVLILNVVNELSYKEVAEVLEIPVGTVMSRLSRAKSMIRDRMLEAEV